MSTTADQAIEVKATAANQLPAEVAALLASDPATLAASGIPAGAVSVGDNWRRSRCPTRPARYGRWTSSPPRAPP